MLKLDAHGFSPALLEKILLMAGRADSRFSAAKKPREPASAAIMGPNSSLGRQLAELEEAWIVFALVREDGLSQVEAANLLGPHSSFTREIARTLSTLAASMKPCSQRRACFFRVRRRWCATI